jgi:uncharacterized membrane protein (DUF4010 family)
MADPDIFIRILLTVLFGALLGLESETRHIASSGESRAKIDAKSRIGGVRTYTILSLFGGVTGLLFLSGETFLAYASFVGLVVLLGIAYFENIRLKGAFGMTTEIAIIITFLLGFFTTSNILALEIVLFVLVILTFFLSQKQNVSVLLQQFTHTEVIDLVKFGIVALVILPLLPNETITIANIIDFANIGSSGIREDILNITIINPFNIWLIVITISGISLLSYMLSKIIGEKRGIVISALLGGVISSTSTAVALANRSRKSDKDSSSVLAGAGILSNAVSFLAIGILITIVSVQLMKELFPILITMFTLGTIFGGWVIFIKSKGNQTQSKIPYEPFSIGPALIFVSIVIALTVLIQFLQLMDGGNLVLLITALSGIIGLDAPTIAIAGLVNGGSLSIGTAAQAFIFANAFNFLSKGIIGYTNGSRTYAKVFLYGLLITILGSLAYFIVLP